MIEELGRVVSADNKWVVVTGAASGIGEGVAYELAEAGYGVVLVDFDQRQLEHVSEQIEMSRTLCLDLTADNAYDALVGVAREVNVWGLVNCAGISLLKHFLLNRPDEWQKVLRVNLEGTMTASQAVGRVLNENGGGAIVNIASVSGVNPAALQAAYAASKAGVIGFTQGLAYDFGPLDITVNVICPGIVKTAIWDSIIEKESRASGRDPDDLFSEHVAPIPVGRAQYPTDVGKLCKFLLSSDARNISGESVNLTGGMSTVFFDFLEAGKHLRTTKSSWDDDL